MAGGGRAPDWAVRTSTVARDVFYYRNLNLGEGLTATLKRFDRVGDNDVILHTSLARPRQVTELADSSRPNASTLYGRIIRDSNSGSGQPPFVSGWVS